MGIEGAVDQAQKGLEKVSEKKWLIGIGKLAGALAAALLTYWQAAHVVEQRTNHVDNKAEAGYLEMVETLQKMQIERIAERKAYTEELASLHGKIDALAKKPHHAAATPAAKKAEPVKPAVPTTPAEKAATKVVQAENVQQVQKVLPPPPKPLQLAPNLDTALQKQVEQKEQQEQQQPVQPAPIPAPPTPAATPQKPH